MRQIFGFTLVFSSILVLGGCFGVSQEQDAQQESSSGDTAPSGYITTVYETGKSATADIEAAQGLHNEQLEAALGAAGLNDEEITNNNKTMQQEEKGNDNAPFDVALAQTCSGAKITTNKGVMEIKLYGDVAPKTVANFCTLAQKGFYEDIIFHRVIKDFMIQGGDPTGTGTGGPGYKFEDELPQAGQYKIGSLAMANSGPDTNGSQFFIVSGQNGATLPPSYSLFGEVTTGLDVVDAIQNTQTGAMDKPVEDIVIEKVEVITE